MPNISPGRDQNIWNVEMSGLDILYRLGAQLKLREDCGFEDNIECILQSYTHVKSPTPAEFDPFHNQICGAWIGVLSLLSASGRTKPFLLSAIGTFATTLRHRSGRNESGQSLVSQMYFDSLRRMGKALEDARGAFRFEHCVAIMCLAVTDILTPMLGSSWMTHVRGVGDLMKHLTPVAFSSGIFHLLFVGFRPLLLISSIVNRQATFLAKEEWTTAPFRGQPVSIMQQLLNQASVLPSLLERYYNMNSLLEITNLVAMERLCQDFQKFLGDLREWELMSESSAPYPLVWSRPIPGNPLPLIGNILWFPNMMTANSLTHYWAFMIIATTHLSTLNRAIATLKDHPSYIVSHSETERLVADLAGMICNSMEYLTQPDMGLHHAGSSFFTLPTAIGVFQNDPARYNLQLSRCRQIVEKMESLGVYFINL